MTQPWSCYVLDRTGINKLDAFFEAHPEIASWPSPGKEHKLQKLRQHYMANLGAIIHLTSLRDDDELRERENFAACAAATQNLLLGAEARGYASFWSSSPAMRHSLTQEFLVVNLQREQFVGSIWLGMPARLPEAPARKSVSEFTTWIE
jgi:nitroreductase